MAIPIFDPEQEARDRLAEALALKEMHRENPQTGGEFGPGRLPSGGQTGGPRHLPPPRRQEGFVAGILQKQAQNQQQNHDATRDALKERALAALTEGMTYGLAPVKGGFPLSKFGDLEKDLRARRPFHPEAGPTMPSSGIDPHHIKPEGIKDLEAYQRWLETNGG